MIEEIHEITDTKPEWRAAATLVTHLDKQLSKWAPMALSESGPLRAEELFERVKAEREAEERRNAT